MFLGEKEVEEGGVLVIVVVGMVKQMEGRSMVEFVVKMEGNGGEMGGQRK